MQNFEKLKALCPVCSSNTVLHDCYNSHVHIDNKVEWIVIQRVICVSCGKTHAVIPEFIKPYKHYSAADIEFALKDIEDGTAIEQVETQASISTVKRWFGEFKKRGWQAVGALRALLSKLFDKTINEIRFNGLKLFQALEHILEEFPEIESGNFVIGDTNLWLTNHMVGIYV